MDYSFVSVLFLLNIWLILSNSEVAAQEGPGIVIVRPAGQDVELPCSVAKPGAVQPGAAWIINHNQYTVASLSYGILDGYSADINSNNLIVKNIMMNDTRNNTEYRCVIIMSDTITGDSDPTFLYVAGVPAMVPGVTVDDNTININGNNVTLTLSWGEPFNNLDPIVNYTVSWSGDVTCPSNFTTTDNTTRSYTINNLIPMTNYTFSVVATNSIGSGEAGVVINITATSSISTTNTTAKPASCNGVSSSSSTTTSTSSISTTTTTATSSISTTTTTATPNISTTTTTATSSISTTTTTATSNISTTTTTATSSISTTTTTATPNISTTTTTATSSISTTTTTATSNISTTNTASNEDKTEGITIASKYVITIIIIIIILLMLFSCGCLCIMFCSCCIQRENHHQYEKFCAHSRISFVAFVILGVLTFGISLLIWFIYLKCRNTEKDDYYKIISVSIFVLGIYTCGISLLLWWMYKGITECGVSSSEDAPTVPLSFLRFQANEVPSVSNKLAEYDDTKASCPTESTQVSVEVPDYASADEMNKSLQVPVAYAVVNSKNILLRIIQVVARQKAAAGALQTSIQHCTTANGEKYALPDKLAAKNKSIVADQKATTGTQQVIQCQNTANEGKYALPEVVVKDKSIRYVEVEELPTSGKIRTSEDTFTPYAKIC